MGSIVFLRDGTRPRRSIPARALARLSDRFAGLLRELAKFGVVGVIAAASDIGVSNLLAFVVGLGPLTSKTLSMAVGVTVAFLGNRYWTFWHRDRSGLVREYFLFFVFNGLGLLIQLLCLGFTVYALRLDGPLAFNISANVVGLTLATAFRFWAYRRFVFLPPGEPPVDPHTGLPEAPPEEPDEPEEPERSVLEYKDAR